MKQLILASSSPRRQALLRQIKIKFKVVASGIPETLSKTKRTPIASRVKQLALQKAKAVAKLHPNATILAADTVVVIDRQILGKPTSPKNATRMLAKLSGREHLVITGVVVVNQNKTFSGHCVTRVKFRTLSPRFISSYVKSGEPMDKAGAYGIQGLGALCVEWIQGDYFNVVGLPLVTTCMLLEKADFFLA